MSLQARYKTSPEAIYSGNGPRWLRLKEAAQYIGAREGFMRRLVRRSGIRFTRIGHTYVIDKLVLDQYMKDNEQLNP